MHLYVWESELLKDYEEGRIVACAMSVGEARKKAFEAAMVAPQTGLATLILRRDLDREPKIIESGVHFIEGSS
jgi:hypothetical protein